jgi:pyrimidine deaminase RibD-like protein
MTADDATLLKMAVDLAGRSPGSLSSFSVGSVIASPSGAILSTGYTHEFGEPWHAEEVAIEKARRNGVSLRGAVLYASMEPCGQRLSGRTPCAALIIAAGIERVVFCVEEPPIFVRPMGCERLREAGVTVERDGRFAACVCQANRAVLEAHRAG